MQILLTNDDGIASPGIGLLYKALRQAGHRVFIVAPAENCSGFSHCISFLNKPLRLKEIEKDTWSCAGTPADCIITALLGGIPQLSITTEDRELDLTKAPDLVLSGINAGANLGTDIIYSGTAAAARQGSFFGIPSIAFSLVDNAEDSSIYYWEITVEYITENLNKFLSFWKEDTFVNINFPNNGKKPLNLVNAFPAKRHYNDMIVPFTAPGGRVYCHADAGKVSNAPEEGSDWREVLNGNAAFSVIESQPCDRGI